MSTSDDLNPTEFVERIRKMGEQRDSEESERARNIEEEILQGRSERAARRAERQRSISPEKVTTPQSQRSSANTPILSPKNFSQARPGSMDSNSPTVRDGTLHDTPGSSRPGAVSTRRAAPPSLQKPSTAVADQQGPATSSPGLGRSGTLSWQQRPKSRGSVRSRPLSVYAAENATKSPRETTDLQSGEEPIVSRNQIAQSLGAKDPSWFRQTADRGLGSAAYRKSQVEDNAQEQSEAMSHGGDKRQLPGLSRESTVESENPSSPPPDSFRSDSPSQIGSARDSKTWSSRLSSVTSASTISGSESRGVLPILESQKLPPPSDSLSADTVDNPRSIAMSPSQGRISPERVDRTPSPTKGLGGFVQSAMLRRSDSQNKRWSAQPGQGLSRQSSTASNSSRPGALNNSTGLQSFETRPSSFSRGNSLEPSSRPSSSHSSRTITQDSNVKLTADNDGFVKPALPFHTRSRSVASSAAGDAAGDAAEDGLVSPSKRWSPTKSTWLESALNKPAEPAKPKVSSTAQQPSWMAELNKNKQQRGSVDVFKSSTPKPNSPSVKSKLTEENTSNKSPKGGPVISKEDVPETMSTKIQSPPISKDASSVKGTIDPGSIKAKPETPPKKDFRANLKSRQPAADGGKGEELEFRAAFGKLKRAETKNYKAPDTFKDNILRGKNDLNITGGPAPRVKKDEFKDSILAKKGEIKAEVARSGSSAGKKPEAAPQAVPEGLARRKTLSRADAPKEQLPEPQPEALARQASLKDKLNLPAKPPSPHTEPSSGKASKLAGRFNPALAGILARGPPVTKTSEGSKSDRQPENPQPRDSQSKELTHMTKGRAKGPKRRAPTTKHTASSATQSPSSVIEDPRPANPRIASVSLVKPKHILPSNDTNVMSITGKPVASKSSPATPVRSAEAPKKLESPKPSPKSPELVKRMSQSTLNEGSVLLQNRPRPSPLGSTKNSNIVKTSRPEDVKTPPTKNVMNRFSQNLEANRASAAKTALSSETKVDEAARLSPTKVAFNRFKDSETANSSQSPVSTPQMQFPTFQKPVLLEAQPVSQRISDSKKTLPAWSPKTNLTEVSSPSASVRSTPDRTEPRDEQAIDDLSQVSVRNATSLWGRQSGSPSTEATKAKTPIKLPTKADEHAAEEEVGLRASQGHKPAGLGLGGFVASTASSKANVSSPPLSGKLRSPSPLNKLNVLQLPKTSRAPETSGVDSSNVFADRFDVPPDTSGSLPSNIDTQAILTSPPVPRVQIKRLRNQIWELSPDGVLSHIPIQEEHVLYEESMYLSTHLFSSSISPKSTEVYLWIGAAVSETVIEDAQLFGQQHAKENGAKSVTTIRQGKEPPQFFEALQNLIVVRRGTRERGSKQFMLCGRQYMSHLVFDEVDLSLKSLCSGFPFVVAASDGKAFLWKGIGCKAEELSGARLIGMDLATSGELIEVDEGHEPVAFMSAFPPSFDTVPRSADHWRYKASSDRYRARLFRITQTQALPAKPAGFFSTQVSNFLLGARRPSWQNFFSSSNITPTATAPDVPSTPPPVQRESSFHTISPVPSPTLLSPQTPRSPSPNPNAPWRTAVVEIAPFSQDDLESEGVYVLDAFFEIYILLGPTAHAQSHAFSTALLFAQEYGILAASLEDRPFIPVSTVVLEGVPRDMKSVFRRWDENAGLGGSEGLMAGRLGRGKSLKVVGLGKALRVTGR